jgi:hypothetical protein
MKMQAALKALVILSTLLLGQLSFASEAPPTITTDSVPAHSTPSPTGAIKVEVVGTKGNYQLLRGGKPYHVWGVGIDHADLKSAADHGSNSIRTWSVDHEALPAQELLDTAHALGMTVSLCLEFGRERQGFDYNNEEDVKKQFEESKARVLKYKDHPALLTWFIGNELNYNYKNPNVWKAVNDVSKMIHELDPNHPTTTPLSFFDTKAMSDIEKYATDLDFISFQLYAGLVALPGDMKKAKFTKPFMVTEWGAFGHWEGWSTKWGAPVENTSDEKAQNYIASFVDTLQPYGNQMIGNYVFLWGQKQERTQTWYGMFLETGEKTMAVDVMHYIWNGGKWPANRSPRVSRIGLTKKKKIGFDTVTVWKGKKYPATIVASDPDGDELSFHWEIRPETTTTKSGGDKEEILPVIEGLIDNPNSKDIVLRAPKEKGAYRLFAYVYDGKGSAAHANIPFYVK